MSLPKGFGNPKGCPIDLSHGRICGLEGNGNNYPIND